MIQCKNCNKLWDNLYTSEEFISCCPFCRYPTSGLIWKYESDGDSHNKTHYIVAVNSSGSTLKETFFRKDYPTKQLALKAMGELNGVDTLGLEFDRKFSKYPIAVQIRKEILEWVEAKINKE